jgi:copper chaperone CopZ
VEGPEPRSSRAEQSDPSDPRRRADIPTQTYDVPGISCEHCQAAIEKEVAEVPGVTDVTVDIDARQATVAGSSEIDAVRSAIEQAGYEVAAVAEQTDPS